MARFYKTASANPLDYMYKMNIPLMERVLMTNDQYINQNLQQAQGIGDLAAQFNYLAPDSERASEIIKQYQNQVGDVSKAIQDDPANWRNKTSNIKNLANQLKQDYQFGEISKIQGNYNTYKQWKTNLDKQVEQWNKYGGAKGGISPDRAKAYENWYINEWMKKGKGTQFKSTSEYNALSVEDVMANMDTQKILGEGLEKMKASGLVKESETTPGMYLIKTTKGWEGVTTDRVIEAMMGNLQNSPQLLEYMKRDSNVGLMKNVFDEKGNLIPFYGYKPTPATQQELQNIEVAKQEIEKLKRTNPKQAAEKQKILDEYTNTLNNRTQFAWNDESHLAPIMKGLIAKNAWMKTKDLIDIKGDPVKLTQFKETQANNRNAANNATKLKGIAMQEAGKDRRQKDAQDFKVQFEKYKFDLGEKAKKGDKAAGKKLEELNAMEYIGELNNPDNTFEGDMKDVNSNRKNPNLPNDGGTYIYATPETLAYTPNGRVQTALKDAKDKTLGEFKNDKDAQEYLDFLGNRKHSNELAREFLERKRGVYQKPSWEKTYPVHGSIKLPIIGTIASWDKPEYKGEGSFWWSKNTGDAALYEKFKSIGSKYNKGIDSWYKTNNQQSAKVNVNPFEGDYQTGIAESINNSPQYFFTIDQNGNQVKSFGKVKRVIGGVGGNNQGRLGYHVEMENGDKKFIFPQTDDKNVFNINRHYTLSGMKDKNSALGVELKNEVVNDVKTTLMQGVRNQKGIGNIITIGTEKFPATLHDDGTVTIQDEDGKDLNTFSSINKFVETIYK